MVAVSFAVRWRGRAWDVLAAVRTVARSGLFRDAAFTKVG